MGWADYIPRLTLGNRRMVVPPDTDLRGVAKADASDIFLARNMDMQTSGKWADIAHAEYYATSTVAYAAVKLRADSVASAPLVILSETGEGLEPVPDAHPIQDMFDRVNPWWTHADLWRATETHLSLFGSAFWFIDQDAEGGPEIWPIRADRVRIIPQRKMLGAAQLPNAYIEGFVFEANGKRIPLTTKEVIWFRYFNPLDEYGGMSPVAPGRLTLDMGRDAIRFNRNFFSEGTHPGNLAFTTTNAYTDAQIDEFYQLLDKRFRGANKSHRPFLLTNGLDAKNIGTTQKDMEFLASLQYTVEDAARVWRVWPELLASGTRAAFRNVGEAIADFWLSTVSNEWAFLEAEVTELLIPTLGSRAEGLVAAFDTSKVPALERARAEENRQNLAAVTAGAMTINEWREVQGFEPVQWGDVWWSPSNIFPVSSAESIPPAPAPVGGAPAEEGVAAAFTALPVKAPRKALPAPSQRMEFTRKTQEKRHRVELVKEMWVKALTRREASFRAMMRGLFRDQQEEVQATIRRIGIETVDGLADLIDEEETIRRWTRRARPLYEDAVVGAARQTASIWGLKALQGALGQEQRVFNPLNPDDPGFKVWLENRMRWWATRTNEATARLLRTEVEASLAAGDSIPEIMTRVEKVFDFSNAVRSERIARTELVAAQNRGNLEMMAASGVVEKKRWLTVIDGRTRESHLTANGQVVGIDDRFIVGEDIMDAPGNGSMGSENINCRCVVIPVIE